MNISVRVSRIFQIKVADLTLNTELVIWSKNLIFGTKIQLCNFRRYLISNLQLCLKNSTHPNQYSSKRKLHQTSLFLFMLFSIQQTKAYSFTLHERAAKRRNSTGWPNRIEQLSFYNRCTYILYWLVTLPKLVETHCM